MNLLKVVLTFSENRVSWNTHKFKVKEKPKTYVVEEGDVRWVKRVDKTAILKVNSKTRNIISPETNPFFSYYVWTLPENKDLAIDMLKEECKGDILNINKKSLNLLSKIKDL